MLPITTLLRAMTEDEVFDRMIEMIVELGLPADKWRKGGPLRVIVRVCAKLYAAFTVVLAAFIASGFLETATGSGLTLLARNVYGVERRAATRAREKMTLANGSANLYEDNLAGSIVVFNPVTKKTYQNAEDFTLEPFSTLTVTFEAVEAGSSSTSAPGAISGLETNLTGVTVTNGKAFVGLDEESDPEVRDACRYKMGALSVRGPRTAYQWAIREAKLEDGVTPVNVNRSRVSTSDSRGRVFIWIASPAGAPGVADVTAVYESCDRLARPDTVRVYVAPCTEVPVTRTLDVWCKRRDGVSASDVKSTIETAFAREGAVYPIGGIAKRPSIVGKVYADWLAGVAKQAWPDTFDVDGTGADEALLEGQVARFSITVNVRLQDVA